MIIQTCTINSGCLFFFFFLFRMAINIGYFGLSLNTSNLSGNPFMNCFLSATTEVPAYVVSTWLLRKCPRRALLSSFLFIGGGVLLLIQFIPDSKTSSSFMLKCILTTPTFCMITAYTATETVMDEKHSLIQIKHFFHVRYLPLVVSSHVDVSI